MYILHPLYRTLHQKPYKKERIKGIPKTVFFSLQTPDGAGINSSQPDDTKSMPIKSYVGSPSLRKTITIKTKYITCFTDVVFILYDTAQCRIGSD